MALVVALLIEEMVMSLVSYIGRERNILGETPVHCHTLKLPHPILTNRDLEKLRRVSQGDFLATTLSALFPVSEGEVGLERALDGLCRRASLAIQDGYTMTPLSRWGQAPEPVGVTIDPDVDMTTPPLDQVNNMTGADFFRYAAELLTLHPPHVTDQPIVARMSRIGIEPGKSFDIGKLDPVVQRALETAPQDAQKLMAWKVPTLARVANG